MRRVLRRFERIGPVLDLTVNGRVIGTTHEHPFFVRGRGWTKAQELRVGDEVRLMQPGWATVEAVSDTGRLATVYNLEIEDDHTYFVGCDEWGFAVWAHNATNYDIYEQAGGKWSVRYKEASATPTKWARGANGDIVHFTKADADAWVAAHQTASTRVPFPGDADFVGTFPKTWPLTPTGDGAHLVERSQAVGRPGLAVFDQAGTPRFYPAGTMQGTAATQNAGAAYRRLHRATRGAGIRLKVGGNPHLTDADLLTTYGTAYADTRLTGIRGDLRTPDSSLVVATDVTSAHAYQALRTHFGI